ncbi:MAG: hypothetical protein JW809_11620 [Pirellulales bacterium]|nr:hypothetical protein [Pirellulales bacterium]
MGASSLLESIVRFLASAELLLGVLWAGLAALTLTLLVLMRTRWGQSQPLRKCLILSLLAHALFIGYATTVRIVARLPSAPGEPSVRVLIAEAESPEPNRPPLATRPWETPLDDAVAPPTPVEPVRAESEPLPTPDRAAPTERPEIPHSVDLSRVPLDEAPAARAPVPLADAPAAPSRPDKSPEPIEAPSAQRRETPSPRIPVDLPEPSRRADAEARSPERPYAAGVPASLLSEPAALPRMDAAAPRSDSAEALAALADVLNPTSHGNPADLAEVAEAAEDSAAVADATARTHKPSLAPIAGKTSDAADEGFLAAAPLPDPGPPQVSLHRPSATAGAIPPVYQLRTSSDRTRHARDQGATDESEAAVRAALKWLADNQEPDGRWNPRRHEAGQEQRVAGRDRRGAGIQADTGMTGLALLTFLAAGHTHQYGEYPSTVRNGLTYLVSVQKPDGSLTGEADAFAAMYCHAMATIAMSEAFAMTGDSRLEPPIRRAVDFIASVQDPVGGGWRYVARDAGDTSLFGWQLMALKSAELAGVRTSDETWRRMFVFLKSVSSGHYGGLASYRPSEQASRSMTAEALVCRQFLGMPAGSPTGTEAGDFLLGELPGGSQANLYYWYYGTLGMYQLQGEHWRRWNEAMRTTLVGLQRSSGQMAGSWDPNTVWGGYGGRIYSTSMATLCLEVYYRYLPLYAETAATGQTVR